MLKLIDLTSAENHFLLHAPYSNFTDLVMITLKDLHLKRIIKLKCIKMKKDRGRTTNRVYVLHDIGMLQYQLQVHEKFILSFVNDKQPSLLYTVVKNLISEIRNESDFSDLIIGFRLKEYTRKGFPIFKVIEGRPNKTGIEIKKELKSELSQLIQDFKIFIEKKNYKEALSIIKDLDGDYFLDRSKVIFNICKNNLNDIKKDYLWGRKILLIIDEAELLETYDIYLKRAIKSTSDSVPDYKDFGFFKPLF